MAFVGPRPRPVVEAAEAEMWREQRVEPQRMGLAGPVARRASVGQHDLDPDDVGIVVGTDPERQFVARVPVDRYDGRDARPDELDLGNGIALDLAPEACPVGHDEAIDEVVYLRAFGRTSGAIRRCEGVGGARKKSWARRTLLLAPGSILAWRAG